MAERIGNLLGQLQFSDDQLQKTQKGLKDAGVSMPNFGNVGRELAKEINEEPDEEPETEDEREGFTERHAPRSADGHFQAETVCSWRTKNQLSACKLLHVPSWLAKPKPLSKLISVLLSVMVARFRPSAEVFLLGDIYNKQGNII